MPSRHSALQSATTDSLFAPHTRACERAVPIAAPKSWNQLPRDVRCVDNTNAFKKKTKKNLFVHEVLYVCMYVYSFKTVDKSQH